MKGTTKITSTIVGGSYDEYTAGDLVDGSIECIDSARHEVQYALCAVDLKLFHIDDNGFAALKVVDDVLGILIAYGMICNCTTQR